MKFENAIDFFANVLRSELRKINPEKYLRYEEQGYSDLVVKLYDFYLDAIEQGLIINKDIISIEEFRYLYNNKRL